MGIGSFFSNLFGNKKTFVFGANEEQCRLIYSLWFQRYALHIVAERYGSLLSKCEVKTFINNKEKHSENWYKFNVQPNPNQTSSEFMKQLAYKLIFDLEALIIQTDNGNYYVADSFTKGNHQLDETYFTDVTVDIYGDGSVAPYDLKGTFKGDKAIYLKYSNKQAQSLISSMEELYADLISNVRSSGMNKLKYKLEIDTTAMVGNGVDYEAQIKKIVNEDFKALVNENHSIIPLYKGFDLSVINMANANSQNSSMASTNINHMVEDILVNVGQIYNVPKSFMLGTYEEKDMDDFLTFGLDPVTDLIGEAINRKIYKRKAITDGTYLFVDTKRVKHFDILSISDAINKLISSGVYTINEVRNLLDEKPIEDKEIGDTHWITRNYAVIGDYIKEQTNYTGNDPKTAVAREGTNG